LTNSVQQLSDYAEFDSIIQTIKSNFGSNRAETNILEKLHLDQFDTIRGPLNRVITSYESNDPAVTKELATPKCLDNRVH
jgi:hypothetical protein